MRSREWSARKPTSSPKPTHSRSKKKIERAIAQLRLYERHALQLSDEGYYVAFSGGKDSLCIKQIAKEAGVAHVAHYNPSTIEPPELLQYIREHHPDAVWSKPEAGFFSLLRKTGLPMRRYRWCCDAFRHNKSHNLFTVVGVRAAESARRAKLWREFGNHGTGPYLAPIVYWTDEDVWGFIRSRGLPYCRLYDEGWTRIGCIGCCMASPERRRKEFVRWPRFERAYKAAAEAFWRQSYPKRKAAGNPVHETFAAYWDNWMEVPLPDMQCAGVSLFEQMDGG